MRRAVGIVLVIAGLWLWFGPWQATMAGDGSGNTPASMRVACAAAPVDLVLYGNDPLGLNPRLGAGDGVAAPPAGDACRTSAWWRTLTGVLLLGIGVGLFTRDRTRARLARLDGGAMRPLGA
jgi:hypothetical protein